MGCSNGMHEDEWGDRSCDGECDDVASVAKTCARGVHTNGCHCGAKVCDCDGCNDMVRS